MVRVEAQFIQALWSSRVLLTALLQSRTHRTWPPSVCIVDVSVVVTAEESVGCESSLQSKVGGREENSPDCRLWPKTVCGLFAKDGGF